ncbi:hypothetical protein BCR43DRAFT_505307 [Syncephalastrum racemosum]|uniref:Uncharacterized protein n=1 Tax=Syncephalastrum racemosum TaxID=13706 RepID=A0A1X2HCA9_SYNRA|nr:hypothetical protein BCR43DRAFT_505307 [Syncephalastrum racemosum]
MRQAQRPNVEQASEHTNPFLSESPQTQSPPPLATATTSSIPPPPTDMPSFGAIRRPHNRSTSRFDPTTPSSLPFNDRAFIEFTRCLYQAKSIVKELETFSDSVCPALRLSPHNEPERISTAMHDPRLGSADFVRRVNEYLAQTFQKFSRLCRILLLILDKMERTPHVKRERIESFRQEVWEQVRHATFVKEQLIKYIQQHVDLYAEQDRHDQQQQQRLEGELPASSSISSMDSVTYSSPALSHPPLQHPLPPSQQQHHPHHHQQQQQPMSSQFPQHYTQPYPHQPPPPPQSSTPPFSSSNHPHAIPHYRLTTVLQHPQMSDASTSAVISDAAEAISNTLTGNRSSPSSSKASSPSTSPT